MFYMQCMGCKTTTFYDGTAIVQGRRVLIHPPVLYVKAWLEHHKNCGSGSE